MKMKMMIKNYLLNKIHKSLQNIKIMTRKTHQRKKNKNFQMKTQMIMSKMNKTIVMRIKLISQKNRKKRKKKV